MKKRVKPSKQRKLERRRAERPQREERAHEQASDRWAHGVVCDRCGWKGRNGKAFDSELVSACPKCGSLTCSFLFSLEERP